MDGIEDITPPPSPRPGKPPPVSRCRSSIAEERYGEYQEEESNINQLTNEHLAPVVQICKSRLDKECKRQGHRLKDNEKMKAHLAGFLEELRRECKGDMREQEIMIKSCGPMWCKVWRLGRNEDGVSRRERFEEEGGRLARRWRVKRERELQIKRWLDRKEKRRVMRMALKEKARRAEKNLEMERERINEGRIREDKLWLEAYPKKIAGRCGRNIERLRAWR